MFLLDKIVSPLLNPLGFALVLLALATLLLLFRLHRTAGVLVALTLLELYAFSTPLVAQTLSASLEKQYPPASLEATPKADVIVVLGGATEPAFPPRQAPDLNEHADRLTHAAELFKAGKAPLILVSGGSWSPDYPPEAPDMRDILVNFGVPVGSILVENQSRDTGENARFSAILMRQQNLHTALLVTSGIHMPRAVAAFRQVGVDVTPSETDLAGIDTGDFAARRFMPMPAALVHSSDALREIIGFLYYRLRGLA